MKLTRVEINNFKKILYKEIFFDDGINVLSQANGWGKTSIFQAIQWCLFNNKPNGVNLGYIQNDKSKPIKVTVDFTHEGKTYEFNRVALVKNQSIANGVSYLKIDGETNTISSTQMVSTAKQIFPLAYYFFVFGSLVNININNIIKDINESSFSKFDKLIKQYSQERLVINKIIKNDQNKLKDYENPIIWDNKEIQTTVNHQQDIQSVVDILSNLKSQLQETKDKKQQFINQNQQIKDSTYKSDNQLKLEELHQRQAQFNDSIKDYNNRIQQTQKVIDQYVKLNKDYQQNIDFIEEELRINNLKILLQDKDFIDKVNKAFNIKYKNDTDNIFIDLQDQLSKEYNKNPISQEWIDESNNKHICVLCGQHLNHTIKVDNDTRDYKKINRLEQQIKLIKDITDQLNETAIDYNVNYITHKLLQNIINIYNSRQNLVDYITLHSMGHNPSEINQWIKDQKYQIMAFKSNSEKIQSTLNSIKEQIDKLIPIVEEENKESQYNLSHYNEKIAQFDSSINDINNKINIQNQYMQKLIEANSKYNEIEQINKDIRHNNKEFNNYQLKLQAIQDFSQILKESNASSIINGAIKYIKEIDPNFIYLNYDSSIGSFTITDIDNQTRDIRELSSGEYSIVCFSIIMSAINLTNESPILFDESLVNIDDQKLMKIKEILESHNQQVILATHNKTVF